MQRYEPSFSTICRTGRQAHTDEDNHYSRHEETEECQERPSSPQAEQLVQRVLLLLYHPKDRDEDRAQSD